MLIYREIILKDEQDACCQGRSWMATFAVRDTPRGRSLARAIDRPIRLQVASLPLLPPFAGITKVVILET